MSIFGQKNASKFKSRSSSWNSLSSIVDTWYPLVSFPFVPRLESNLLVHVLFASSNWFEINPKKLTKNLVLENNKFQVARRVCLEFIVVPLTSSIQAEKLNLCQVEISVKTAVGNNKLGCFTRSWKSIKSDRKLNFVICVSQGEVDKIML